MAAAAVTAATTINTNTTDTTNTNTVAYRPAIVASGINGATALSGVTCGDLGPTPAAAAAPTTSSFAAFELDLVVRAANCVAPAVSGVIRPIRAAAPATPAPAAAAATAPATVDRRLSELFPSLRLRLLLLLLLLVLLLLLRPLLFMLLLLLLLLLLHTAPCNDLDDSVIPAAEGEAVARLCNGRLSAIEESPGARRLQVDDPSVL